QRPPTAGSRHGDVAAVADTRVRTGRASPHDPAADPAERAASPGPARRQYQGGFGMTTHATPGELRLRLHLPAGRIDITTWDEPRSEERRVGKEGRSRWAPEH